MNAETRTKYPQIREPGSKEWKRISWVEALDRIARLMKDDHDKNFIATNNDGVTVNRWTTTGFLAASATTNKTALLTYKVVRGFGMVVFDNQARVCHGSTVASLAPAFGRGAMTNSWTDIKNTGLAVVMGGNAAEAHPRGFKWVIEAKAHRSAKLIVGSPLHWGFMGAAKKGFGPNSLTPVVGDANMETPESKAFLVNIEAINPPVA